MPGNRHAWIATAFVTELGWMATLGRGTSLRQLTIGNASPAKALAALDHDGIAAQGDELRMGRRHPRLIARLQAFAEGVQDDFLDVEIEPLDRTEFALRVIDSCRRIPCGQTLSYGELARWAQAPRAARAVGTVMSTNCHAIIVPCHRVVRSNGGIGGYTCPAGIDLKKRLLSLETKMGESNPQVSRRQTGGSRQRSPGHRSSSGDTRRGLVRL